ncbi:MAG: sulfatase-like hydrolase/transferase [Actinomycetota bacterium]
MVSTGIFKTFYFLLFTFANFYEYSYQNLYGRFSTAQDLSLAFLTTPTQKVDALFSYLSLTALIPSLAYLILLLRIRKKQKFNFKKSIVVLTVFICFCTVFNLTMWLVAPRYYFYEAWNNSFGAASRTFYEFAFTKVFYSPTKREAVEKPNSSNLPLNNIVLVLDESVRGDHLSLNGYGRPTTPFLDDLAKRNLLQNWGIAASASTRSFESFQYVMTGVSPDETADIQQKVRQMPTIFQYAKAMNYRTYYFDGQSNDFWGGDSADLATIDVLLGTKYFNSLQEPEWETDFKIAAKVKEIINTSTGNFILVFKHGNHTPYNKNFPTEAAVWLPTSATFAHNLLNLDRETFINTYDNAIRYNLDGFFQIMATDYSQLPNNTVILYSSDHGQTLSEDGELYSHGGESRREAIVPLFMLGLNTKADTDFKAMHANIFPTLLDLMNYPEEMRKHKYAISLLKAKTTDSKERYFMTPNVGPGEKTIETGAKIKFD